jgi:hypothetical protein
MILVLCTLAVIGAALICYRHIRGHLGTARQGIGPADVELKDEHPALVTPDSDDSQRNLPKSF